MTIHVVSVVDSYTYGFVLQEVSMPFTNPDEFQAVAHDILDDQPAERYPHLAEIITERGLTPGYDYADEFAYGLSRILAAVEPDEV
ncbi:TetR/AcrR family transcriptional regulator C-terminal domain-containing protein [Microlunatus sp. Y2014]|uniref:TetR/AcrR family transcriptional regulator C-terminal domain-containing protein n=1 Tax=Microlunatus sp. Y2014 TaxID=3418488 RepID=UPI003DA7957A